MSSAFKLGHAVCWGTAGAIEEILSRAADLSSATFGAEDPLSILLAEERRLYWGGKVVSFEPSKVSLGRLAAVLEGAREQAFATGQFTEIGIAWLSGPLTEFCEQVKVTGDTSS